MTVSVVSHCNMWEDVVSDCYTSTIIKSWESIVANLVQYSLSVSLNCLSAG